MTVRELIRRSLVLIGAIADGVPPTASELADTQAALVDLLDSWSTERLLVLAKTKEVFQLVPGQQNYTIGNGGDFDMLRPINLEYVSLRIDGKDSPIEVLGLAEWAAIFDKLTSGPPRAVFNDNATPLSTLSFYPVFDGVADVVLYGWNPLAALSDLNAEIQLAPGFARALRYNLAVEVASDFGKTPSDRILELAVDSKANIKSSNQLTPILGVDSALARNSHFNIITGE